MHKDSILRAINAAIAELENIRDYYPKAEVNIHILQLLIRAKEEREKELKQLSK